MILAFPYSFCLVKEGFSLNLFFYVDTASFIPLGTKEGKDGRGKRNPFI